MITDAKVAAELGSISAVEIADQTEMNGIVMHVAKNLRLKNATIFIKRNKSVNDSNVAGIFYIFVINFEFL